MTTAQASLTLDGLGELGIERLAGSEGMNRLPRFDVSVLTDDPNLDLGDLLGTPALLALVDDEAALRQIPLVVDEAAYTGVVERRHRYQLALTSPLARLEQVLEDADLGGDAAQWRLTKQLYERRQCVHYDESEWDFALRLLGDEGIACWHEIDGDRPVLMLGDAPASHDDTAGGPFGFDDGSGLQRTTSAFFRFERAFTEVPTASNVREYDVRQPSVFIEGRSGQGLLEQYEYPAWTLEAGAAERRAKVRLEQHQREADIATGSTRSVRLVPGRVIELESMPDAFATDGSSQGARACPIRRGTCRRRTESRRPSFMQACLLLTMIVGCDSPTRGGGPRIAGSATALSTVGTTWSESTATRSAWPSSDEETDAAAPSPSAPKYFDGAVENHGECDKRFFYRLQVVRAGFSPAANVISWARQIVVAHPEFHVVAAPKGTWTLGGDFGKYGGALHTAGEIAVVLRAVDTLADEVKVYCGDLRTCERFGATWQAVVPEHGGSLCREGPQMSGEFVALGDWTIPQGLPSAGDLVGACARSTACWVRLDGDEDKRKSLCAGLEDDEIETCARKRVCGDVVTCLQNSYSEPSKDAIARRIQLYPRRQAIPTVPRRETF